MKRNPPLIVFTCPETGNVLAATPHRSIADHVLRERYPVAIVSEVPWQGDGESLVWGIR